MFSINRYLSSRATGILAKTPITPNQVTFLALVFGAISGAFMAKGTQQMMLIGAFWLHVSFLLDNCDGELARLKSMVTPFGRRWDLFADFLVDCFMWVGLGFGAKMVTGQNGWIGLSILCCVGSALNEGVVVWERRTGCCASVHLEPKSSQPKTLFKRGLAIISHNGDVIFLVWILAIIGSPMIFLISGVVYIYILIALRIFTNRKTPLS